MDSIGGLERAYVDRILRYNDMTFRCYVYKLEGGMDQNGFPFALTDFSCSLLPVPDLWQPDLLARRRRADSAPSARRNGLRKIACESRQ